MKTIFEDFGIELLQEKDKFYLRFDAGELEGHGGHGRHDDLRFQERGRDYRLTFSTAPSNQWLAFGWAVSMIDYIPLEI